MKKYINCFFDIMMDNKKKLIKENFKLIMFSIPYIGVLFINIVIKYKIFSENTYEEAQYIFDSYFRYNAIFIIYKIISAFIFLSALTESCYSIRNIIWDIKKNVSLHDGFKETFKGGILHNVLFVIINEVFLYSFYYIQNLDVSKVQMVLIIACLLVLLYLNIFIYLFAIAQNAIYQNTFFEKVKNAFIFAIVCFPKNFIFYFLTVTPIILIMISGFFPLIIILITFVILIGVSLFAFIWMLYAMDIFDKYINCNQFKNYYQKGLEKYEDKKK